MTSPLRDLSRRARVLSLNCSLFVALTITRLAQWRRFGQTADGRNEEIDRYFFRVHKKNIPTQKNNDMFRLFFGVVVGSINAFGRIFILTA